MPLTSRGNQEINKSIAKEKAFHGFAYAPLLQAHTLAMVDDDFALAVLYKTYQNMTI